MNMATSLSNYLNHTELAPALPDAEVESLAAELGRLSGLAVYPRSITLARNAILFLGRRGGVKQLGLLAPTSWTLYVPQARVEKVEVDGEPLDLTLCETTPEAAAALRSALPHLRPRTLGLKKSAGCGDRLGSATPGHIRAGRRSSMALILAQQSVRENARTGRTPQQVMDDALWGVFQEGWREGFGADADHLKTTEDIDSFAAAGFTFFTIDPSAHVDNAANTDAAESLRAKVAALPWAELGITWGELRQQLGGAPVDLGEFSVSISEEELLRAAAKYGRVVAHTVGMYRHLEKVMSGNPFELEMSVDETETVTSLAEHIYIAHELRRLGVKWVSLAPRYVGDFEKGVDYIGDVKEFERSFAEHLAVSRTFGPYKLSLHSGSDKFSIYPVASRLAGELVHLKTAGTSYLEALRAVGKLNAPLFREIVAFAKDRYATDRATYHVSAEVERMPDVDSLADGELTSLLDDFHAREVLHVTFGSVLHRPAFRERFFTTLDEGEETYTECVEAHFNKHFAPFGETAAARAD
jgi:tagaturonate epimerase